MTEQTNEVTEQTNEVTEQTNEVTEQAAEKHATKATKPAASKAAREPVVVVNPTQPVVLPTPAGVGGALGNTVVTL